jgi:hypothetical protein
MEEDEKAQILATVGAECRASHRHPVQSGALLSVIGKDLSVHCDVLDLSQGGCRLRARGESKIEAEVRIEVTFTIRGLPMLLPGVVQWTDGAGHFGIRFTDMSSRRRDALVELLTEIAAFHAGELARAASGGAGQRKTEIHAVAQPPLQGVSAQSGLTHGPAELGDSDQPASLAGIRERRAYPRQNVDSTAVISLLNVGIQLRGQLLDLSLNGCRVRTDERSRVSVHTRVNAELLLDGVLFRLNGVIEANEDQRDLRIRFENTSDRQLEKLQQLMDAIKELEWAAEASTGSAETEARFDSSI